MGISLNNTPVNNVVAVNPNQPKNPTINPSFTVIVRVDDINWDNTNAVTSVATNDNPYVFDIFFCAAFIFLALSPISFIHGFPKSTGEYQTNPTTILTSADDSSAGILTGV